MSILGFCGFVQISSSSSYRCHNCGPRLGDYFISFADILDGGSVHEGFSLCVTVCLYTGKDGGRAASIWADEAGGRDEVGSKMSVGDVGCV